MGQILVKPLSPSALPLVHSEKAYRGILRRQRTMYWLWRFASRPFLRSCHMGVHERDLIKGARYLLVANHQSSLDPFVMCAQVPFRIWQHLWTLHYMTANYFMNQPVTGRLLVKLGCFPAQVHHQYHYGIAQASELLKYGHSVLMFPEGRRTRRGERPVRHGVELLAREPNVLLVPIHIEWRRHRFGRTFQIGVGQPFDARAMTAEAIVDHIYNIPLR